MSEWWTYSLADFLMYTPQTFERLLVAYNDRVYPAQLPAFGLGIWLAWAALRGTARQLRIGLGLLGVCWLWIAYAFFWRQLATIDLAAPYFAHGFAIQGALLLGAAFALRDDAAAAPLPQRVAATLLVDVAVVVMPAALPPLTATLAGGATNWGTASVFGLAPDATAIATLGFLAASGRLRWLLAIPLLWCIVSGALLWTMRFPHALAIPVLAALAMIVALRDPDASDRASPPQVG